MKPNTTVRGIVTTCAAAAVIGASALSPTALAANNSGLFGSGDPTYDGVYRQGLAITALAANEEKIPANAIQWLLRQQCDDGSFQSYRANVATPCAPSDAQTFSGPDSNSTALGALALLNTDDEDEAKPAIKWLRKVQNADGGFGYYRGGTSDTNSTGLVLATLNVVKQTSSVKQDIKDARIYLKSTMVTCSGSPNQRGKLSYVAEPRIGNDSATAQGALGLVTSLPSYPNYVARKQPRIRCQSGVPVNPINVRDSSLDALQRALVANNGLLPGPTGAGQDQGTTAFAAIALASAERSPGAVNKANKKLRKTAQAFVSSSEAGALATLLLFAAATDSGTKNFGGINLSQELYDSQR